MLCLGLPYLQELALLMTLRLGRTLVVAGHFMQQGFLNLQHFTNRNTGVLGLFDCGGVFASGVN